jgi:hypothetical protein
MKMRTFWDAAPCSFVGVDHVSEGSTAFIIRVIRLNYMALYLRRLSVSYLIM